MAQKRREEQTPAVGNGEPQKMDRTTGKENLLQEIHNKQKNPDGDKRKREVSAMKRVT